MTRLQATAIMLALAAVQPVRAEGPWTVEAESEVVRHHKAVQVVEDATASAGHVLSVPTAVTPPWNVVFVTMPADVSPGHYRATLRMQLKDAADIGKGWRVDVRQGDALLAYAVAYGLDFKGREGYLDFNVDFDVFDSARRPTLYMRWSGKEGQPTALLDRFAFARVGDLPPVRIARVWPDKIRYKTGETGSVTVDVQNLTQQEQPCDVRLALHHDLDPQQRVGVRRVLVPPRGTRSAEFAIAPSGEYGFAARATVAIAGTEVDSDEEYFCVHDNPYAVATGARDEELPNYYSTWFGTFYSAGASDPAIAEAGLHARQEYVTCAEFFSWSPGECFYMAPDEPVWIRGNGGNLLRSKRELKLKVAALKQHGIGCITYIAFQAMGQKTIEILRQRPEWFTYSADSGDVIEFYNVQELIKHREFWKKFDWDAYRKQADPSAPGWKNTDDAWKAYTDFWKKPREECMKLSTIGYFVPNYKLPEVVDYCADQVIASAKMFGWDGLRWDCGHLNTGPIWGSFRPYVDFHGRPLAETPEQMVSQTVANLRRLKARVRAALPGFAIGTNYGSWMETHKYPDMTHELCRDGGWMLDEVCYGYNRPTSPYHWWDKYYAIMADEGEYVTSLGGHYNPFSFNRNGGKYPADRLYETIIRLAAHGHPQAPYFNSRTPAGNYSQFCVRFGRYLFDPQIRRIDDPSKMVALESPSPVWWEKTVGRWRHGDETDYIIHLINPPVAKEAETDPMSRLPTPIQNVAVSLSAPADRPVKAWALCAESWTAADRPRTQAVPLAVSRAGNHATVILPELLFWKMIVFRLG